MAIFPNQKGFQFPSPTYDHETIPWRLASPEFSAQLAIDLKRDLLSNSLELFGVVDGLEADNLTGDRLLHAAQLFDGRVSVSFLSWDQSKNQLNRWVNHLTDLFQIGFGTIIRKGNHLKFDGIYILFSDTDTNIYQN